MIDRLEFSVEDEAKSLAFSNAEADSDITEIWWFPDKDEIRLIEVDPKLPVSKEILPYRFSPDISEGIHFKSAIALIRPDEKRLAPPENWVGWDEAKEIFHRSEG